MNLGLTCQAWPYAQMDDLSQAILYLNNHFFLLDPNDTHWSVFLLASPRCHVFTPVHNSPSSLSF